MPSRSLHPCRFPGCDALVSQGNCPQHSTKNIERDPQVKRLYNSRRWQSMRVSQLAQEPWCAECLSHGEYVPANEVDHVNPHRGDSNLFFGGRLQSLCKVCHSRKTASEVFAGRDEPL